MRVMRQYRTWDPRTSEAIERPESFLLRSAPPYVNPPEPLQLRKSHTWQYDPSIQGSGDTDQVLQPRGSHVRESVTHYTLICVVLLSALAHVSIVPSSSSSLGRCRFPKTQCRRWWLAVSFAWSVSGTRMAGCHCLGHSLCVR